MTEQLQLPRIDLVERDEEITLLRDTTQEVIAGALRAVYIEARGGLGKTRLLQDYPKLIRNVEGKPLVLVAKLIDMYRFEYRKPIEFGRHIVDSLIEAEYPDGLDKAQLEHFFVAYNEAYNKYHTIRGTSQESSRTAELSIHQAFVNALNQLAQHTPLVLRFDTFEEVINARAPKFAFVYERPQIAGEQISTDNTVTNNLVINWFNEYIPQLQRTLILIAGRPALQPANHQLFTFPTIVRNLNVIQTRLGMVSFIKRQSSIFRAHQSSSQKKLDALDEIDELDDRIPYIQKITGGLPLLIALFTQACLRGIIELSVNRDIYEPPPRNSFELEDRLITQIFSLLDQLPPQIGSVIEPEQLQRHTFVFSLFILSCARRGICRRDLRGVFNLLGIARDDTVIDNLADEALIKSIQSGQLPSDPDHILLFLHDEIQVLIDQSRKLDQLNYRGPILKFLCEISADQVRTRDTVHGDTFSLTSSPEPGRKHDTTRIGPVANHLYYELSRDIAQGYSIYTIYVDRLLRQRYVQDALILAEIFWSTLRYRVNRGGELEWPLLDQLAEAQQLTVKAIEYDEAVRYVKRLRFSDKNTDAVAEAERIYATLIDAKVLPAEQQWIELATLAQANPYVFCDLCLTWASALMRAQTDLQPAERLLTLLHEYGKFLETISLSTSSLHQQLIQQRRAFFLAEILNTRGQLHGQQHNYLQAIRDLESSIEAFKTYKESSVANRLNDEIERDLAQVHNNLAYRYIHLGMLQEALDRSNQVLKEYVETDIASAYQKPLFYNTNALIHLQLNQYDQAKVALDKAKVTANESGVDRVSGLVAWAEANYLRARWNNDRRFMSLTEVLTIEINFDRAIGFLQSEPRTQSEVWHDRARLMRDLVVFMREQGEQKRADDYWRDAKKYLDRANKNLDTSPTLNMRRANIEETYASLYLLKEKWQSARQSLNKADELMAAKTPMPRYAQVIVGKIALQRGFLLLRQGQLQAALEQWQIALARVYFFSRDEKETRDQVAFEKLLGYWVKHYPIPHDELKRFLVTAHAQSLMGDKPLPDPQPNGDEWPSAWERSRRFFKALLKAP